MQTPNRRRDLLVREALGVRDFRELDGFRVGQDYVDGRGNVGKLVRLYARPMPGHPAGLVLAVTRSSGHSTEQRFDVWQKQGQRPATPAEVEDARAASGAGRMHAARSVDTSKQGT